MTFSNFLNRNSFLVALSDFLHSTQQDLNLRTTLGGGYARSLKRTTNSTLACVKSANKSAIIYSAYLNYT
jgi:hypothetical protein